MYKMETKESVGGIIALVTGIGIGLMVLIFVGVLAGQTYQLTETNIEAIGNNIVINETFTPLNNTEVSLDHSSIQSGTLIIINSTTAQTLSLANFSIDYDTGILTLTHVRYNNTELKASYTWGSVEIRSGVKGSITSGFSALETTGDYLPIVVLAIVIGIVLSMVLGMTAFKGNEGGGSAL
jgi:hypothetical protein